MHITFGFLSTDSNYRSRVPCFILRLLFIFLVYYLRAYLTGVNCIRTLCVIVITKEDRLTHYRHCHHNKNDLN